jgi:hypothetical protein
VLSFYFVYAECLDCLNQNFVGEVTGCLCDFLLEGGDRLGALLLGFDAVFEVEFEEVELAFFSIDELKDLFEVEPVWAGLGGLACVGLHGGNNFIDL